MSKISGLRFVNIIYGNKKKGIPDITYHVNADHTLFNLNNGGGKTVQIQLILSMFEQPRYWNLKPDNKFSSLFRYNSNTSPAFIMSEWKLDSNAGYMCNGYVIGSPKDDSDNNGSMDVTAFIMTYNDKNCTFSLQNLPLVNTDKVVMTKDEFLNGLVSRLKKSNSISTFHTYRINNGGGAAYLEALQSYRIDYYEWQTIIREINKQEGALATFFKGNNTTRMAIQSTKSLMKEWFLPRIDEKMKGDHDSDKQITAIQKAVAGYAENAQSYMDMLRNKDCLSNIAKQMPAIVNQSKECINIYRDYQTSYIDLGNFYHKADVISQKYEAMLLEKKTEEASVEQEIHRLLLEKYSYNLIVRKEEEEAASAAKYAAEEAAGNAEDRYHASDRAVRLIDLADKYHVWDNRNQEFGKAYAELYAVQEKRATDIQPKINYYGYVLNKHYTDLSNKSQQIISNLMEDLREQEEKIIDFRDKIEKDEQYLNRAAQKTGELTTNINRYDTTEEIFNRKYHAGLSRTLIHEYSDPTLDEYETNLEKRIEKNQTALKEAEDKAAKTKKIITSLHCAIVDANSYCAGLEAQQTSLENEKKKNEQVYADRMRIADAYGYAGDLYEKQGLLDCLSSRIQINEAEEGAKNQRCEEIKKQIGILSSDSNRQIPKKFLSLLDEYQIRYKLGLQWLDELESDATAKERMIEEMPLLPYSIIMRKDMYKRLQEIDLSEMEPAMVPVTLIEDTNHPRPVDDDLVLSGTHLVTIFPKGFVDTESRKTRIAELENEWKIRKEEMQTIQQDICTLQERKDEVNREELTRAGWDALLEKIKQTEEEIEKQKILVQEKEAELHNAEDLAQAVAVSIFEMKQSDNLLANEKEDFLRLKEEYSFYLQQENELVTITNSKKQAEKTIADNKTQLEAVQKQKRQTEDTLNAEERRSVEYKDYLNKYVIYNETQKPNDVEANIDMRTAEQRLDALTRQISDNEKRLTDKCEMTKKAADEAKQDFDHLLRRSPSITEEECRIADCSMAARECAESEQREAQQNKRACEKKLHNAEVAFETAKKETEHARKDFDEHLSGNEKPLQRSEIKLIDFDHAIAAQEAKRKEIKKAEDECRSMTEKMSPYLDSDISAKASDSRKCDVDLERMTSSELGKYKHDLVLQKTNLQNSYQKKIDDICTVLEQLAKNNERQQGLQFINVKENFQACRGVDAREMTMPLNIANDKITAIQDVTNRQLEALDIDCRSIESRKNDLIDAVIRHAETTYNEMDKLSNGMTIKRGDKTERLLRIKLPDASNTPVWNVTLKTWFEKVLNETCELMERGVDIEKEIRQKITTESIIDHYCGFSGMRSSVRLYYEDGTSEMISFEQSEHFSGAESFVLAFILLAAAIRYSRSGNVKGDESDMTVVMDNPFGTVTAEHFLSPVFALADKTHIQLLCFTALNDEEIYKEFNNIYRLAMEVTPSGKEVMQIKDCITNNDEQLVGMHTYTTQYEQMSFV